MSRAILDFFLIIGTGDRIRQTFQNLLNYSQNTTFANRYTKKAVELLFKLLYLKTICKNDAIR